LTAGSTSLIGVVFTIPRPWGDELAAWRRAFGDPLADAVPPHVTLLPPTPVPGEELPAAEEHLRKVAERSTPFDVHLRGTGTFRPITPVVFVHLAAGIGGCERVEQLVRSGPLSRELEFPYHPHVTVAHELPDDVLDRAYAELASYEARFLVEGFSLYEHLDGVWQPLRDFAFGVG